MEDKVPAVDPERQTNPWRRCISSRQLELAEGPPADHLLPFYLTVQDEDVMLIVLV
jgi:hypothetical protein